MLKPAKGMQITVTCLKDVCIYFLENKTKTLRKKHCFTYSLVGQLRYSSAKLVVFKAKLVDEGKT